jgi:hypothetical protein
MVRIILLALLLTGCDSLYLDEFPAEACLNPVPLHRVVGPVIVQPHQWQTDALCRGETRARMRGEVIVGCIAEMPDRTYRVIVTDGNFQAAVEEMNHVICGAAGHKLARRG